MMVKIKNSYKKSVKSKMLNHPFWRSKIRNFSYNTKNSGDESPSRPFPKNNGFSEIKLKSLAKNLKN